MVFIYYIEHIYENNCTLTKLNTKHMCNIDIRL